MSNSNSQFYEDNRDEDLHIYFNAPFGVFTGFAEEKCASSPLNKTILARARVHCHLHFTSLIFLLNFHGEKYHAEFKTNAETMKKSKELNSNRKKVPTEHIRWTICRRTKRTFPRGKSSCRHHDDKDLPTATLVSISNRQNNNQTTIPSLSKLIFHVRMSNSLSSFIPEMNVRRRRRWRRRRLFPICSTCLGDLSKSLSSRFVQQLSPIGTDQQVVSSCELCKEMWIDGSHSQNNFFIVHKSRDLLHFEDEEICFLSKKRDRSFTRENIDSFTLFNESIGQVTSLPGPLSLTERRSARNLSRWSVEVIWSLQVRVGKIFIVYRIISSDRICLPTSKFSLRWIDKESDINCVLSIDSHLKTSKRKLWDGQQAKFFFSHIQI